MCIEVIHIWTADVYETDKWSSQWISNLSNWNKEAWKKKKKKKKKKKNN